MVLGKVLVSKLAALDPLDGRLAAHFKDELSMEGECVQCEQRTAEPHGLR